MRSLVIFLMITALASIQGWTQNKAPDEKTVVNKEYDENGNLIKYDSTYVWQWNSDSTMNFSFDDNFTFGKQFSGMFGDFFNDSVFEQFGFLNHQFPSFKDDVFFRQFQPSFPDSTFIMSFPAEKDSAFEFQFGHQFPGLLDFQELEKLQEQFEEQFKQHSFKVPEFNSPEQQEEWEKLMKKQQKEKEDLMKKWKGKQS